MVTRETFADVEVGEIFRFYRDLYAFPYRKRATGWAEPVRTTGYEPVQRLHPQGDEPVIRDQKTSD